MTATPHHVTEADVINMLAALRKAGGLRRLKPVPDEGKRPELRVIEGGGGRG